MVFFGLISDWLSKAGEFVEGTMLKAVRTLFYALDTLVYRLIIDLYDIFESLCSARLLSNDILKKISSRIGLVLGLVMFFYVVFGFIQMLLEPDKITDKEKGAISIVKKVIIVIVMLGVSDFGFNTLYMIQTTVIKNHVISRLLLPYSIEVIVGDETTTETKSIMDNERFGSILSEELLHTFYYMEDIDDAAKMSTSDRNAYLSCEDTVNSLRLQIVNYKRFDLGYNCLNESVEVQYKINNSSSGATYSEAQEMNIVYFNWLFSLVCGVAVAYLMFMYCFKVGIRMVQLMFMEAISPMAFVSYLSPKKDSTFSKWSKIYFSTYIDVFIRVAIINFVFFIISAFFSKNGVAGFDFWNNMNVKDISGYTKAFYVVVIVLALLSFAHKAPDLLKDLLGSSASKLGFGASMKDIVGLQKAIGTVAVAATGAAVGFFGGKGIGAIGGILRGAGAGFGAKNVRGAFGSARKAQAEHNVAARLGQLPGFGDRISGAIGSMTTKERYDKQVDDLEKLIENEKVNTASIRRQSAALSNASGYKKKLEERAENKLLNDHFSAGDVRRTMQENLLKQQAKIKVAERSGNAKAIAQAQMEYNEQLDRYKQEYITRAAQGTITDNGMNAIFDDFENEIRINADGAFNGMTFDRSNGYAGVKAFDDTVTTRNATISRDITISDSRIKKIENQVQSIKNSQGYRDSHKIK